MIIPCVWRACQRSSWLWRCVSLYHRQCWRQMITRCSGNRNGHRSGRSAGRVSCKSTELKRCSMRPVSERRCTELSAEPCHPSQRYRVTAAPSVCSTEHTCGPTLQTDHIRPSSIFCCGSHSAEQSSCRIQRPDNQRCLLPTAFKDSSVCTTASAP